MSRKILLWLAWGFVTIGVLVTLTFLGILYSDGYRIFGGTVIDYNLTSQVGGFIGGVVGPILSIAGFFFLVITLKEQRDAFYKERLESKFFELINFHRQNVDEMSFTYSDRISINEIKSFTAEKRKVFKIIHVQFIELFNEVNFLFDSKGLNDIYTVEYSKALLANSEIRGRNIDLIKYAKLDILYLIVFFGAGRDGVATIRQMSEKRYQTVFISKLLLITSFKPKKESNFWQYWTKFNKHSTTYKTEILEEASKHILSYGPSAFTNLTAQPDDRNFMYNEYEKYYGGHQFRLGHYFRHFFQSVAFIDKDKQLSYDAKYSYIKILRGQLSTYEQIIFFLNSLSQLGRVWEFEKRTNPTNAIKVNNQLITKYNMIKNIPNEILINDIKYSDFYPFISYEVVGNDEAKVKRKLLKKIYS